MPRTKLIDFPLRSTDGSERVLVANNTDTFCGTLSTLELSHNAITSLQGNTARSFEERLGEVINVKDHGAKGDGYTSDTQAIQSALDAAYNKTVVFPSGVYNVASSLRLPPSVRIVGYNAVIKQTTRNKHIFISSFTNLNPAKNIVFEGLTLQGYGVADTALTTLQYVNTNTSRAYGIWFQSVQDVTIFNCTFLDFKNAGIFIDTCKNISITNNTFKGTRPDPSASDNDINECGSAMYFLYGVTGSAGGCIITNNRISDVNYGIKMDGNYPDTIIGDNTFLNIGAKGIYVCPSDNLTIYNNLINALNKGIEVNYNIQSDITPPQNIRIIQNNIRGASVCGIHVLVSDTAFTTHYLNYVKIFDNTLNDITDYGNAIKTNSCRNVDISNNSIKDVEGIGINCEHVTGRISGNMLSRVNGEMCNVRPIPYGQCTIHSNTYVDGGNTATGGYINALRAYVGTVWQRDQVYPVDSFVVLNNRVYRSLNGGRSSMSGTGPTGLTTYDDNGIVWLYCKNLVNLDGGEVHVTQNVITASPLGTPNYCLYAETALRLDWRDNNFPVLQITSDSDTNNKALKALILSTIINERDNTYGGQASGDYASLAYSQFALGVPSRNLIGTQPPTEREWQVSDKVWNVDPVAESYLGWVCVESGTPGVWEPFGYLGARGSAANLSAPDPGQNATDEQVVLGADTRLTDTRIPKNHASTHALTGTDPITPESIGAFASVNNLSEVTNTEIARRNLGIGSLSQYDLPEHPGSGNLLTYNVDANAFVWTPSITELSIGAANGIAGLDENAKVPLYQLPEFIIEAANYTSLPPLGEFEKLYIARDTSLAYVWNGSSYVTVIRASNTLPPDNGDLTSPYANIGTLIEYARADHRHAKPTLSAIAVEGVEYLTPTGSAEQLTNFPILNQNTTGTASNVTDIVTPSHGGTGVSSITGLIKGNGSNTMTTAQPGVDYLTPTGNASQLTNFPILNQSTTGTASNITGVVSISNGGTGASNTSTALINLGAIASNKIGAANGVASLGADGKVPSDQLPSYVDDIVERATFALLPTVGETGKLYVTLDNDLTYRWTGSLYKQLNSNLNGDVQGISSSSIVTKIQGRPVTTQAPQNLNSLLWLDSANAWVPSPLPLTTKNNVEQAIQLNDGSLVLGVNSLRNITWVTGPLPTNFSVTYTRTTNTITISGDRINTSYGPGSIFSLTNASQTDMNSMFTVVTVRPGVITVVNPTPNSLLPGTATFRATIPSVSIGHRALINFPSNGGYGNIAIGYYSALQTSSTNAICIGSRTSSQTRGVAIGYSATTETGVSIGAYATSSSSSVVIGPGARGLGDYSSCYGLDSYAESGGIAIGNAARADAGSVAIASTSYIGYGDYAPYEQSRYIRNPLSARTYSISIGTGSSSEAYSVAIGLFGYSNTNSIAVGSKAAATTRNSIAIGTNASTRGLWNIAPIYRQAVSAIYYTSAPFTLVSINLDDVTGYYYGMKVITPNGAEKSIVGVNYEEKYIQVDGDTTLPYTASTGDILTFKHPTIQAVNCLVLSTTNIIKLESTQGITLGMECISTNYDNFQKSHVVAIYDRFYIAVSNTPIINASNVTLRFSLNTYRNTSLCRVTTTSLTVSGVDLSNVRTGDIVVGACFEGYNQNGIADAVVTSISQNNIKVSKYPTFSGTETLTFLPAGGIAIGMDAVTTGNSLAIGSATCPLDTRTTIGPSGPAAALPSRPKMYIDVTINGVDMVIPAYNRA